MNEPSTSLDGDGRTPPLAPDLASYSWKVAEGGAPAGAQRPAPQEPAAEGGEGEEDELTRLRVQVRHFTAALEDILTLALSNADYKERAIMMHRRAVAALSVASLRPPNPPAQPQR